MATQEQVDKLFDAIIDVAETQADYAIALESGNYNAIEADGSRRFIARTELIQALKCLLEKE
jgi:hypothetical protein